MTPGQFLRHGSPRRSATPSPTNLSATASSPGTSRCSCAPARGARARRRLERAARRAGVPPAPPPRRARAEAGARGDAALFLPPGGERDPEMLELYLKALESGALDRCLLEHLETETETETETENEKSGRRVALPLPAVLALHAATHAALGGGFARPPPSGACYPASRRTAKDRGRCIPARAPRSSGWCTRHSRSAGGRRWRARRRRALAAHLGRSRRRSPSGRAWRTASAHPSWTCTPGARGCSRRAWTTRNCARGSGRRSTTRAGDAEKRSLLLLCRDCIDITKRENPPGVLFEFLVAFGVGSAASAAPPRRRGTACHRSASPPSFPAPPRFF